MPTVGISWYEAYAYAAWLGGRLPTEAEWDYAARAGRTTQHWSSDEEEDIARLYWYMSERRLHEVGEMQQPNPWGLHDMYGNVWEWVADWSGEYPGEPQVPWGPPSGLDRVWRGGSFVPPTGPAHAAAFRSGSSPENRDDFIGFRVVLPGAP